MSDEQVERKYALLRLGRGDYLLPGNDGRTLYRLHTHVEGPSSGLEDMYPRDTTFWAIKRWHHPISAEYVALDPPDPDDWDQWVHVDEWFRTRREAVQAVLKL